MKIYKHSDMINGWFIGNFSPSVIKTDNFEVCLKDINPNIKDCSHYHLKGNEVTLIVSGILKINNKTLKEGDIFLIEPNEKVFPVCLKKGKIIAIRDCSIKNNKINII